MDTMKYLERINYSSELLVDKETLFGLHQKHVFGVPFENLDIHYRKIFDLQLDNLYRKIVLNRRGGFCYELNALFNELLCAVGFKSTIISAMIFDSDGCLGPAYDHMCVWVEVAGKQYLADVGFGDLFTKPLEIREGVQSDERSVFKIENIESQCFVLSMSTEQMSFQEKYIFDLANVRIEEFDEICLHKQTHPLSYFVKNTICTKPTSSGRITLFNNEVIEKVGSHKTKKLIDGDDELRTVLKDLFGIEV